VPDPLPPIIFIRHGETDWNKRGLIQGSVDTDLNENGHAQSRAIARHLISQRLMFADYQIVCSPQKRTRQTAAHLVAALERKSDTVVMEPLVRELGFGIWESKPFWELKASQFYPADPEERFSWRPQGGESYEDGVARVSQWLAVLHQPTILVAHGAIGRCLIGHVAQLTREEIVTLNTPQGCWSYLNQGRIEWFDAMSAVA
jgi:broad specificity phosphatase PhoE